MAESNTPAPVTSVICFTIDGDIAPGHDQLLAKAAAGPPAGFQSGFWAWETNPDDNHSANKSRLYWILNWESLTHAQAFTTSPTFPDLVLPFYPLTAPPTIYHAPLTPHPPHNPAHNRPPLPSSPALEVARITLSPSTTPESWRQALSEFKVYLEAAAGYVTHNVGFVAGEPGVFLVLVGWTSVQAHYDFAGGEEGREVVGRYLLSRTVGVEMAHVLVQGELAGPGAAGV